MTIDPALLEILACPKCKGDLTYQTDPDEVFICAACRLLYRVEDGIPNFLIDEAETLPDDPDGGASEA